MRSWVIKNQNLDILKSSSCVTNTLGIWKKWELFGWDLRTVGWPLLSRGRFFMSLSSLACDKHDHKPHVFFWPFHTMYAKINFSHSFLQLLSLLSCIFSEGDIYVFIRWQMQVYWVHIIDGFAGFYFLFYFFIAYFKKLMSFRSLLTWLVCFMFLWFHIWHLSDTIIMSLRVKSGYSEVTFSFLYFFLLFYQFFFSFSKFSNMGAKENVGICF